MVIFLFLKMALQRPYSNRRKPWAVKAYELAHNAAAFARSPYFLGPVATAAITKAAMGNGPKSTALVKYVSGAAKRYSTYNSGSSAKRHKSNSWNPGKNNIGSSSSRSKSYAGKTKVTKKKRRGRKRVNLKRLANRVANVEKCCAEDKCTARFRAREYRQLASGIGVANYIRLDINERSDLNAFFTALPELNLPVGGGPATFPLKDFTNNAAGSVRVNSKMTPYFKNNGTNSVQVEVLTFRPKGSVVNIPETYANSDLAAQPLPITNPSAELFKNNELSVFDKRWTSLKQHYSIKRKAVVTLKPGDSYTCSISSRRTIPFTTWDVNTQAWQETLGSVHCVIRIYGGIVHQESVANRTDQGEASIDINTMYETTCKYEGGGDFHWEDTSVSVTFPLTAPTEMNQGTYAPQVTAF